MKVLSTLSIVAAFSGNALAENLRSAAPVEAEESFEAHLDLELDINGERQLFPLLPGTRCPTGHTCRTRTVGLDNVSPMIPSLKKNIKTSLSMSLDWIDLNKNLNTVVASESRCDRRQAMARAAALAAGVASSVVAQPAFAAETKEVKMGDDNGQLVFVPAKISICKGDTVTWTNNKAGPHNVVFDEDAVPSGVNYEDISICKGDTVTWTNNKT